MVFLNKQKAFIRQFFPEGVVFSPISVLPGVGLWKGGIVIRQFIVEISEGVLSECK